MTEYRAAVDSRTRTIRFFEQYEDAEAAEARTGTEHFQAFEERLPDLLAGEPEIVRFEVSDATTLDM